MGNFKVCLVVLLATFLPSYVQLQDVDDPCATVRCLGGHDCVASYDDCKSDDIHKCTAKAKCVIRTTTEVEFAEDSGSFKACNLFCIIGRRCVVKDGQAQCIPDTTSEPSSVTPASSWEDPCDSIVCKDDEQCYPVYGTCETGTCPPSPVCVPTFEEAEDDVSDTPPVTPASSWVDPCSLVDCKDGEQCFAMYHTCETGTCPPEAVCVPILEELEDVSDTPPVTPASSWEDPCNLVDCKDGEQCHAVYHTCETGTCPPTAVCFSVIEEEEENEDPPVTPASSWQYPCQTMECKDGETCFTIHHTCEAGITCPPTGVCVPAFEEESAGTLTDLPDETPNKDWICSSESDFDKICDKECPETYECRCRTLPAVDCFAAPCLFPVCTATNDTDTEGQCSEFSDRDTLCEKDCPDSLECRCITPPDVLCESGPCLFPTCVSNDTESKQQCTLFDDAGTLCEADCLESEECRCITPPQTFCFVGPCLFPTCVDKNSYSTTLDNSISDTTATEEN